MPALGARPGVEWANRAGEHMNNEFQFRAWVESCTWTYAKTMPQWPHEYTSINRKRDDPDTVLRFEYAVAFIRENGVKRRFTPTNSRFVYFDFDGLSYWTMGWPVYMTIVINRGHYDPALHVPVKPRKPKGGSR